MTSTEAAIQAGIKAEIAELAAFADADVVINDWAILDNTTENAPYIIIQTAEEFESRMDTVEPENTWSIIVAVFVRFVEWKTSLDDLQTRRQAILDRFNTAGINARSADGIEAVSIDRIYAASAIEPYFDPYLHEDEISEATPIYLYQVMIFETREW